ncbi:spore coat protein [Halobacillus sp. A5]|uniref:spore coat protein n=1 Tax=Halobacillus sp. A5 TaxID=2880263 RepID=UPI0020A6CB52|nr:spore coat protein [Halobacillus sp. A5]MCP3025771.1 spore coat protein [Halobacillus sp. A5]
MDQQVPNPNTEPSEQMPPSISHGGHELFDAHEVIASIISLLDQYQLYNQHMQDPELKQMADRQSRFLTELYNIMVECLQTGSKPAESTHIYKMEQSNDVIYGMQPAQPKKPNQSIKELSDQGISAYMLGQVKSLASLMSMTALEMTNPVLRRVVADSVPNLIEMSYEVFLYQNKHSYYQVPQLAPQDLTQMTHSYTPVEIQDLH